jgi:hypothetical protein
VHLYVEGKPRALETLVKPLQGQKLTLPFILHVKDKVTCAERSLPGCIYPYKSIHLRVAVITDEGKFLPWALSYRTLTMVCRSFQERSNVAPSIKTAMTGYLMKLL